MNTDPVAGTRPRRHADYVRTQQPLIEQFGRTTRHLRREVSSLDDRHATELYIPLVRAVYREANDLKLFLSSVIARDQKLATRVYSQLVKDEQRTAAVASAQFPKVRALRSYSSA